MNDFDNWWSENYLKHNMMPVNWSKDAWNAAIDAVIAEWEKPYVTTDGRKFIDRLRGMKG